MTQKTKRKPRAVKKVTSSYARGFLLAQGKGWWLRRGLVVQLGAARAAVGGVGLHVEAADLQAMVALAVGRHMGEVAVVAVDVTVGARSLGVVEDHLARGHLGRREDVQVELVVAEASAVRLLPGAHLDLYAAGDGLVAVHLHAVAQVDVDALDVGVQVVGAFGRLLGLELDVLDVDGRLDVHDRVDTLAHAVVRGVAVERCHAGDETLDDRVGAEVHSDSCKRT